MWNEFEKVDQNNAADATNEEEIVDIQVETSKRKISDKECKMSENKSPWKQIDTLKDEWKMRIHDVYKNILLDWKAGFVFSKNHITNVRSRHT